MAPKKRKPTNELSQPQRLNPKTNLAIQKENDERMVHRLFPVRSDIVQYLDAKDLSNFAEASRVARNIPNQVFTRIQTGATCADITNNGKRCLEGVVFKNQKSGIRKNCRDYCVFYVIQQIMNNSIYLETSDGQIPRLYSITTGIEDRKTQGQLWRGPIFSPLEPPGAFEKVKQSFDQKVAELAGREIEILLSVVYENIEGAFRHYSSARKAKIDFWFRDVQGNRIEPFGNNVVISKTSLDGPSFAYEFRFT